MIDLAPFEHSGYNSKKQGSFHKTDRPPVELCYSGSYQKQKTRGTKGCGF
jgi:hypothetical protein